MARGSRRRKRPLKGLLAWVGLALLALVAAKKAVERFMGHESTDDELASGTTTVAPDADSAEHAEDEGP